MNKKLIIGGIIGIIAFSLLIAMVTNPASANKKSTGDARIGVIYIDGEITGSRGDGGLLEAGAGGPSIMEQLQEVRQDDSIKAVLLRINSPGGSAATSQEIGDEIDKVKAKGKIVVVSMGDVAASGGYWIAAKADKIMANPATMTGSIGVIMETMNIQGLYNKIGVTPQTVKSGVYKDIGSPNRPLTDAERGILQGMVNDIFNQFVDVVAKGRKMDKEKVLKLADGQIFTGKQAQELGLVDELGNYYDAITLTKKMAKLGDRAEVYELEQKTPFEKLFGSISSLAGVNRYSINQYSLSPNEIQLFRELLRAQPALQNR
jgi:protease-4